MFTQKKTRAREFGRESGHWPHGGDDQSLLANSLNVTSLSLPGMISLADPTWRKHSIIWSSRGNRLAMEKNLAAGVVV